MSLLHKYLEFTDQHRMVNML